VSFEPFLNSLSLSRLLGRVAVALPFTLTLAGCAGAAEEEEELRDCELPTLATATHTVGVDTRLDLQLLVDTDDVAWVDLSGEPEGVVVGFGSDGGFALLGAAEEVGTFEIIATPAFPDGDVCTPPAAVPTFTTTLEVTPRAEECDETLDCDLLYGAFSSGERCSGDDDCGPPIGFCASLLPGTPGTCQDTFAICGDGTNSVAAPSIDGGFQEVCVSAFSSWSCTPRGLCIAGP
jgi:hypothetical protein